MKRSLLKVVAAGVGIILAGGAGVRGGTLYQDTAATTGQIMNLANGQQVGQEIWLGPAVAGGLTNFSLEYYSPFSTFTGPVQMDVRLYLNDGTPFNGYATPSTIFFDSGNFTLVNPWTISGTNSATVVFQLSDLLSGNTINLNPNFFLPTNFTFTVTVTGMQGADTVGLPIFTEPPAVGANFGDYWYDVSGNWELLTNSIGPVAFGAKFQGTVPEPSVLYLGGLGAAVLAFIARRRQWRG
jgi:hypothetical protein